MIASINSKSVLIFIGVQQNGIYLDAEADQHQGGGQTNPSKIVDLRVEDIRVVGPAATHQNKTQGNESNAYKEKEIIFPLENKLLVGFLIVVFLAHGTNLIKTFPGLMDYICRPMSKSAAVQSLLSNNKDDPSSN